jgi:hypothetical protein
MKMLTRPELKKLRQAVAADPASVLADPDLLDRLLDQAEYGLDCAALLDDAVHFPAEPYGEAETLVTRLTNGVNAIWNRFHYRTAGGDRASS